MAEVFKNLLPDFLRKGRVIRICPSTSILISLRNSGNQNTCFTPRYYMVGSSWTHLILTGRRIRINILLRRNKLHNVTDVALQIRANPVQNLQ